MHEHFDYSKNMRTDSAFRRRLLNTTSLSSHDMNAYGDALTRALEKHAETHRGETELTAKNFDDVMKHLHKDEHYLHATHVYEKKTGAWENALRNSLKMPPPANDNEASKAA